MKALYLLPALVLVCGCDDSVKDAPHLVPIVSDVEPNLDDPAVLDEIRENALVYSPRSTDSYGVYIDQVTGKPYDGWLKKSYQGNVVWIARYRMGLRHGPYVTWWETNPDWKTSQGDYVEGEQHGRWLSFYSDGKTASESVYDAGRLTSVSVWKPDGTKCPESHMDKNGNGVVITYFEDGKGGIAASKRMEYENFKWR